SPPRSSSTSGAPAWLLAAVPRPAPRSAAAIRYAVAPPRSAAAPRPRSAAAPTGVKAWVPARAAAEARAAKAMPAADPTKPAVRPAAAPPAAAAARLAAAVGADRRAVGRSKRVDRITQVHRAAVIPPREACLPMFDAEYPFAA